MSDPAPAPPTVEIDVNRNLYRGEHLGLGGLWAYRHLLLALIVRDVRARYKQTWVGVGWAVLQPALMTLVFSIFLGPSGPASVPYTLYVYSGFMVWTFFSGSLLAAANSVVAAEGLITKVHFPRLLIPWGAAGAVGVDLLGAGGGLALLLAWYGVRPTWSLLLAPVPLAVVALAAWGVGTLFAALNVQYRDFRYLVPFLVQLWMFATPQLFLQLADGAAPAAGGVRGWLWAVNPLNGVVPLFRAAVLGGPLPEGAFARAAVSSAALLVLGCWYFRRVEHTFADII